MAKSNASEMLTSLDSLFTTQEQRDEAKRDSVQDIPISQISDFPEHPFKVKQDEAMLEMAESVRQYGVLVPGLVRQLEDGSYQMVSGHRRKLASELAGRDTIPCIVRDLTDDEAVIIMVDSNLQRERVLPSEKAFAYKMKLDAMRRQQGERTDLTSAPVGQKFDGKTSRELLAIKSGQAAGTGGGIFLLGEQRFQLGVPAVLFIEAVGKAAPSPHSRKGFPVPPASPAGFRFPLLAECGSPPHWTHTFPPCCPRPAPDP